MKAAELDEETRALLKKIVEGYAYRQLALANIRGRALEYVFDLDEKLALARGLLAGLERLQPVRELYHELRHGNVVPAIRAKVERVPYPASQIELALCQRLWELAHEIAASCYESSSCDELAAIARTRRAYEERPDDIFVESCAEPALRPQAQAYLERWLGIALMALGRPGSRGDRRAVELGLRDRHTAELAGDFLRRIVPFCSRCGLRMPSTLELGIELPPSLPPSSTKKTR